jgi:hypothetical protein
VYIFASHANAFFVGNIVGVGVADAMVGTNAFH